MGRHKITELCSVRTRIRNICNIASTLSFDVGLRIGPLRFGCFGYPLLGCFGAVLVDGVSRYAWVEAGLWLGVKLDFSAGHGTPRRPVEAGAMEAEGASLTTAAAPSTRPLATRRFAYISSLFV